MLKISLPFKNVQTSRVSSSRTVRIKNVKFTRSCFCMNTIIKSHFQICISVPLSYTNADLKISQYDFVHIKTMP